MADFGLSPPHAYSEIADNRLLPRPLSTSPSSLFTIMEEETTAALDVPNKQKRKRWKKPADHPKRPLSAYNLFFQWGRERLISGEPLSPLQQDDVDQINVDDTKRTSKRRHRREHGVIGFTELAKMLGARWRELDQDYKVMFQKRAGVEKRRYEKAVAVYKAEKRRIEQDTTNKQSEATLSSSSPTQITTFPARSNKRKKAIKLQSTKRKLFDGSFQQQTASLREDVETIQPRPYHDAPSMLIHRPPGLPFAEHQGAGTSQNQGNYSNNLYRGEQYHQQQQYEQQHEPFRSVHQASGQSTLADRNHMAQRRSSFFTPPVQHHHAEFNHPMHPSNGTARDWSDPSMWDRGMSSSFHPHPHYYSHFDGMSRLHMPEDSLTPRYWSTPTDVPDYSYSTMPPPPYMGNNMPPSYYYPPFPVASPLPNNVESGPQQAAPLYQGIREEDGLSTATTSPLYFFE